MKASVLLLTLTLVSISSFAQQIFDVGALNAKGVSMKMAGVIVLSDSSFSVQSGEVIHTKKVVNKSGYDIYVSDGTATDKVTIAPFTGRTNGFKFDHSITINPDSRFSGNSQIIYFCRKRL